jgi:hypothetical protein
MSAADFEEFETITSGYKVASSIDLVDLEKVIAIARARWETLHSGWALSDDTIRVTADGEHISIHWTDRSFNTRR